MAFDVTMATPSEKRAVLALANRYDGGQRSVDTEQLRKLLGTEGREFEALLRSMSRANLIRHQTRDSFSVTAMIVDAADKIKAAPAFDKIDGLRRLAGRRKLLAMLVLLFGGAGLLLFAAGNALRGVPEAPKAQQPAGPAQPHPAQD